MQNYNIPQIEIQRLSSSILKEISVHSLGQWLKLKTEDKFIILPRQFAIEVIDLIEKKQEISQELYDVYDNSDSIKFYL